MNKITGAGIVGLVICACLLLGNGIWIPVKAQLAQYLLHQAWEESLATGQPVKPWPWADTWPVARLRAPKHGVDVIVLAGTSGESLAFGPGHLRESSKPGVGGNCVLAGHRDTSFAFLRTVKAGEKLILQGPDGKNHSYQVTDTAIMDADTIELKQPDEAWLTLITCYPFRVIRPGGPLRFIIFARMLGT